MRDVYPQTLTYLFIMKRSILLILIIFSTICVYAQNHIKFNGSTFGQQLNTFTEGFVKGTFGKTPAQSIEKITYGSHYNPDLYDLHLCTIDLNAREWQCSIHSSRKTNIVFQTVSVRFSSDLKNDLMYLVKTLEEKYGGHKEAAQDELGKIYYKSTYWDGHQEMLALTYYIKNSSGLDIGEVRISCAPTWKDGTGGYIELNYKDYAAIKTAQNEYNTIMKNAL